MNVVCSSWSIWIIHLACRARSRALNGRTRTATLTDVIFRMTIFRNNQTQYRKKRRRRRKKIRIYDWVLLSSFLHIKIDAEKDREERKKEPRDRECIHSFIRRLLTKIYQFCWHRIEKKIWRRRSSTKNNLLLKKEKNKSNLSQSDARSREQILNIFLSDLIMHNVFDYIHIWQILN